MGIMLDLLEKREISHWVKDQEEKEYIDNNKKISKGLQAYYKTEEAV